MKIETYPLVKLTSAVPESLVTEIDTSTDFMVYPHELQLDNDAELAVGATGKLVVKSLLDTDLEAGFDGLCVEVVGFVTP